MTIKETTQLLLTKHPDTRDDFSKFLRGVLFYQVPYLSKEDRLLITKHFKTLEGANRQWRKVQQDNPELRGRTWNERQTVKTKAKRKELGYLN